MVAEGFALVDVGDVHFENWKFAGLQRIHDRDRGMRERRRIDDDASDGLARLVDPVDELMLGVALLEADREAEFAGKRPALRLDVREGLVAVDMRLAFAEQVQIWPVEDQNSRSHCARPGRRNEGHCALRAASWQLARRSGVRRQPVRANARILSGRRGQANMAHDRRSDHRQPALPAAAPEQRARPVPAGTVGRAPPQPRDDRRDPAGHFHSGDLHRAACSAC